MKFKKKTLESKHIKLEPLEPRHKEELKEAILDGELWKLFVTVVPPIEEIDSFFENAQKEYERDFGITYAIVDKKSNKVVGSTRFSIISNEWLGVKEHLGFKLSNKSCKN